MTRPSGPVVVGTDGSTDADRAVVWAADEAVRRNRPLRILHAVQPWVTSTPVVVPPAGLLPSLEETGRAILDAAERLAREHRPRLEATTAMVLKTPAQALREQAGTACEIIVGSRGSGGFTGMLLGSTGLHVAGHVPGPVVIVRGEGGRAHDEVVVGIDPGSGFQAALGYALEAASLRRARLRVVHGWRPATLAGTGHGFDAEEAEDAIRQAIDRAMAPHRDRHPDVEVATDVIHDHPVHALARASHQADLIVVGSHDRHGLGALRLGSVSHGVVHHAHCPVAIVRPGDDAPAPNDDVS